MRRPVAVSVLLAVVIASVGCGGGVSVSINTGQATPNVNATATQIAASIFATQTANAPTAAPPSTAPVPTSTPVPTAAPAATSTTAPVATRTTAPSAVPSAPASGPTSTAGIVTQVVMAQASQGANFDPVGVTTAYKPNQSFHAIVTIENAPANSSFRAEWYAVDVGAAAAPNTKIGEYTLTADGTRNLDFTFTPKTVWPDGTYSVKIYVNDALNRTVTFTVRSNFVTTVTLCKDVKPDTFDPIDPTTQFAPSDVKLHAVVPIKDAPANTQFVATWFFGDQKIDSTTITSEGTRNLDFNLTQSKPWPTGDYHVTLEVNGKLDQIVPFQVK